MTVYIVWNYDDGILGIYADEEHAKEVIQKYHDLGIYDKEDTMLKEEVLIVREK